MYSVYINVYTSLGISSDVLRGKSAEISFPLQEAPTMTPGGSSASKRQQLFVDLIFGEVFSWEVMPVCHLEGRFGSQRNPQDFLFK